MRDRQQLELSVSEYRDAKAVERQAHLKALMRELAAAREDLGGWYWEQLEWCRAWRDGDQAKLAELGRKWEARQPRRNGSRPVR